MSSGGPVFYRLAGLITRALLRSLSRCEVRGLEHVPRTGPLIVVANHLSQADPIIIAGVFPRPVRFIAKHELMRSPLFRLLLPRYGAFTVRRGEADRAALRRALQVLQDGEVLGLFPEGTRSRTGQLQAARAGVGYLALRSGAPRIPVGIAGTEQLQPSRLLVHRPRLQIRVGPTIDISATGPTTRQGARELTERMMRAIAELLPPERRGAYAEPVAAAGRPLD